MISVYDYLSSDAVPYGKECEPAVLWHMPAHTYLRLELPTQSMFCRLLSCGRDVRLGSEYAVIERGSAIAYSFKAFRAFIPVSDQEALQLVPIGSKVELYAQDPALKMAMIKASGHVVSQLTRRVRVQFSFSDGSPGERTVPVSRLIF